MVGKLNKIILFLLIWGLMVMAIGCATQEEPQKQDQAAENTELQSKIDKLEMQISDQAPNGCNDCHKKISEDKDYSLATQTNKIEGHPQVEANTVEECLTCHGANKEEFMYVLHKGHLNGEIYKDKYDQNCRNCHVMQEDGSIVVKDWPEQD